MACEAFDLGADESQLAVKSAPVIVDTVDHLTDIFPDGLIVQVLPGWRCSWRPVGYPLSLVKLGQPTA